MTRPLPTAVVDALHDGVDRMAKPESFKGYGPEQGYEFLRELVARHDFGSRDVNIAADEVFISDGAKCDSGNIQEIFAADCRIAVADPVYPVYVDTNVMAGRTGPTDASGRYEGMVYMPCLEENGFLPALPSEQADLVYLCFPNNPTGTVASKEVLGEWVAWARANDAIILFDAAYEAFISDPDIPHSIYEVDGAREVAIEFRSFSKTAGFTGTRCAYTVVPKELRGVGQGGESVSIHSLWNRRQSTKFNGVSYPVQVGTAAIYSDEGKAQVRELVSYYMEKRSTDPRRSRRRRPDGLRWRKRAVHLDQESTRTFVVGLFRSSPRGSERRRHARVRFWPGGRRLLSPQRVRRTRRRRRRDRASEETHLILCASRPSADGSPHSAAASNVHHVLDVVPEREGRRRTLHGATMPPAIVLGVNLNFAKYVYGAKPRTRDRARRVWTPRCRSRVGQRLRPGILSQLAGCVSLTSSSDRGTRRATRHAHS